jgi:uncharacterized caspase-like protein
MFWFFKILPPLVLLVATLSLPAGAAPSEKRLALVVGNASYKSSRLATTVNDAALVADSLRAACFTVTGGRDLDEGLLRQAFRDFIDRLAKAGPDTVAVVYFAGYGLQLDGENYLLPVDANITEVSDVPRVAVRLSDQTRALAELRLKATFVILDAARKSPPFLSGLALAGGLGWVEPEPNMLIAFNAAPGTVSANDDSGCGQYARALAEMILEGGLPPAWLFDRVRLRVNEQTKGAQVPWDASSIETPLMLFDRGPGAPARADSTERTVGMRSQPMLSLGARDAYLVALTRDTFDAYTDFLADYWQEPTTRQIRALLAVRRENIIWRRSYQANVANAYWSYLEQYPRGPHVADAHRLLAKLGAAVAPAAGFVRIEYDVPPPLPDELQYIERPVIALDDPAFRFEPPPQPPVYFLEPAPDFLNLTPGAPVEAHALPPPKMVSLPPYIVLPAMVVPPPPLTYSGKAREMRARVVSSRENEAPTKKPDGQAVSSISAPDERGLEDRSSSPRSIVSPDPSIRSHSPATVTSSPGDQEEVTSHRPARLLAPSWAALDPAQEEMQPVTGAPALTASLIPFWATDYWEETDPDAKLPWPATNTKPPPAMDAAIASPPTGSPLRGRHTAMGSPRTTERLPSAVSPTTAGPAPQPVRNPPGSTTVVNQASPTSPPRPGASAPSTHLSHLPKRSPGVSPAKPQGSSCQVVNGKPFCL